MRGTRASETTCPTCRVPYFGRAAVELARDALERIETLCAAGAEEAKEERKWWARGWGATRVRTTAHMQQQQALASALANLSNALKVRPGMHVSLLPASPKSTQ